MKNIFTLFLRKCVKESQEYKKLIEWSRKLGSFGCNAEEIAKLYALNFDLSTFNNKEDCMKEFETQIEKEIKAVKTVLDISKLIISKSKESGKDELLQVIEMIFSTYIGKIISKQAMEVAIRKEEKQSVRERISKNTLEEIDSIEKLLKEKGIL